MLDKRRPSVSTIITVHRQNEEPDHHHHLSHVNPSPEPRESILHHAYHSLAQHGWPIFKHDHLPPLASVSTDREPLMGSDRSTTPGYDQSTQALRGDPSFTDRYGRCLEIIHYGANTMVRMHEQKTITPKLAPKQLLAVKVYRYSILNSDSSTTQTSTCSPLSLAAIHPNHPNILPILDLLYNDRAELCVVTPYCAGGDLRALLSEAGSLPTHEANCVVAQLLRALAYLHEHHMAHRDICPKNVFLTDHGAVKLAGFGDGHIRRLWKKCAVPKDPEEISHPQRPGSVPHSSASRSSSLPWPLSSFSRQSPPRSPWPMPNQLIASIPGLSLPFTPPEAFHEEDNSLRHDQIKEKGQYDPRPADIWATAMIYMLLINGRLLWRSAHPHHGDDRYLEYLRCRNDADGYPPIEALGNVSLRSEYSHVR